MSATDVSHAAAQDLARIGNAIHDLRHSKPEVGEWHDSDMDAWLLPYVDTITTLLALYAFFVSLMEYPQEKRADVQAEIHKTFSIPTLIELPEIRIEMEAQKYLPDAERLIRAIKSNGLERDVSIKIADGKATLTIADAILFAPASADISSRGDDVLRALGAALNELPGRITVSGHTDSTPIATEKFKSNLDLSFARAMAVIDLYTSLKIPEDRFRAVANAATLPVASDDSEQGRSLNRRVEISVDLAPPAAESRRP